MSGGLNLRPPTGSDKGAVAARTGSDLPGSGQMPSSSWRYAGVDDACRRPDHGIKKKQGRTSQSPRLVL